MRSDGLELYRKLYLCRRAEERIIEHDPENEMRTPMHMSMGQEFIAVAVCHVLNGDDQVFASYRSHAVFLAKTGNAELFFAELYGRQTGTAGGKGGSMHLSDPANGHLCSSAVVASCLPVAVGAAFANKVLENERLCVVFFGDGALDAGVFWESLNAASLYKVPLLFVFEDNELAVHTFASARQATRDIADVARQMSVDVFESNSTDVEEVADLFAGAAAGVRATGSPAFLRLKCYRYLEHVGTNPDFEAGYRSKEEYERWFARDCVITQRSRLLEAGIRENDVKAVEIQVDRQIEEGLQAARIAPFPPLGALYRGVFHEAD